MASGRFSSGLTTEQKITLLWNAFTTLDVGTVMRYAVKHHLLREDTRQENR